MNRHDIFGKIISNVELRTTSKNVPVTNLIVSTSRKTKNPVTGNIDIKFTTHFVKVWGKLANVVISNYKKGDHIFVSGRSETREHDGKTIVEIVAKQVESVPVKTKK